jgi:plasmid maintenance system antidote protein VapI
MTQINVLARMSIKERLKMKLKDYLYFNELTIVDFSIMLGYSRGHISNIVNGRTIPTFKLALVIERMTNGQVKAEELIRNSEMDSQ